MPSQAVTMATVQGGKVCGLSKDVTLAVLPRLHQEELLLELGRRNILVGETYKKESLVSKLWFLMIKEYQGMVHSVTPSNPPTTGTSRSSASEQRNMWVTLSNDLQELMETVTSTNTAANVVPVTSPTRSTNPNTTQELMETVTSANGETNTVPITGTANCPTQTNGTFTATSANGVSTSTLLTTAAQSSYPTQTQPLTSVTIASPQQLPMSIFAQEVVVETATEEGLSKNRITSPRRSPRLHTSETQDKASSSSLNNLGHIGEVVETYQPSEENPATKDGLGKGKRKLCAMAVTRSTSCSVGSNTVVTDLGAMRELVDEDGEDSNEAEDDDDDEYEVSSDDDEDEVSSDEDDDPLDDDDDSDWQPDSPVEDRQPPGSSKRKSNAKDGSSGITPEEATTSPTYPQQPPHKLQKTSSKKTRERGFQLEKELECPTCGYNTRYPKVMKRHIQGHGHKVKCPECEFTTESTKRMNQHMTTHDKTRLFACKLCDYRGRKKGHLQDHMRVHTGEQSHKCRECNFTCKFRGTLTQHMAMKHGTQCLLCEQCGFRTTGGYALKVHMRKHTGEKPYKCSECSAAYRASKGLERHVKASHPGKNCYKCDYCPHLTESLTLLREHKKIHKAAHEHKCPVRSCTFSSDDRDKFFDHLSQTHGKSQQYFCNICNHKTYLMRELKEHMKTHGDVFKCDKCEFSANTYATFRHHIANHKKTEKYKCDKCDFTSNSKSVVLRHTKDHGDIPFQCPHCEYKADTQDDLSIHLGKHANVFKAITCGLCGYIAKTEERLEQHIAEHDAGLKMYKCDFRGCDFSTPDHKCFVRHVTSHDPSRKYPCKVCDYRARKRSDLATHMRLHTGEKPLKCSKCPFAASLLNELKRHEAGHGSNYPNMCNMCGFTARSKNSLAEHKKLHSGEALMEHPSIGKEGAETHQCLHCDFKASDGHELYLHAMKHINEEQEDEGDGNDEEEKKTDKDDSNS
ncbi:zinc finger protein 665-like [Branchiostoma floridae]|uniref:Zinc finger protein 665-like n=1 Tax=Branchiostoma floridae TaxID=7739 RepID=A0A9J7KHC8_BRAFL|nr:zinc finger protein 665-like [Branchiostoma floridae]